jgi:hypothetical protein
LFGKWDESMHYVNGDYTGKGKGHESLSEAHLLWKRSKPPIFPTRYNFTRFAITLNELTPGLKVCFVNYSPSLFIRPFDTFYAFKKKHFKEKKVAYAICVLHIHALLLELT